MPIVKKSISPSRDDAVRITRTEKLALLWFGVAVSALEERLTDLAQRLDTVPNGRERLETLYSEANMLMDEVLVTVPANQRRSLENTKQDYNVRLAPKLAPFSQNVIMTFDEFKALVDNARAKCRECTEDDKTCSGCQLYNLLTSILPLDDYSGLLCPYNMGEWGN